MKIEKPVLRATAIVGTGVLVCSVIMQLVYLIVVLASPLTYHYSFILGNLLMGVTMVLNFFLMSLNMQKTIETGNTDGVRRRIQFNHILRNFLFIGVLVVSFIFRQHFHIIATIITVSFPQITIFASHLILRKKNSDAPVASTEVAEILASDMTEAVPPSEEASADVGEEEDG